MFRLRVFGPSRYTRSLRDLLVAVANISCDIPFNVNVV